MNLTVNNHSLTVDLVQNSSTEALLNLLKVGDITYEAHDYGNFEKVGDIGHTLPRRMTWLGFALFTNQSQNKTAGGRAILANNCV